MKKIVLIGFAACYKSTVGRLLADRLSCAFVDTDAEIERACNKTVQQIFETHGEAFFREEESKLLRTLTQDNAVVACGGGVVLSQGFSLFAQGSIVICLTASAETVHSRLGGVARPLFDGLTVRQLDSYIQSRAPLYAKYADVTIPTDRKTPEQLAQQIYNWLNR
ncbi:MAG: shikimate kinase [Clostridiales bacterium]|nr:shikimate kinase [Clostridiales bacterium]